MITFVIPSIGRPCIKNTLLSLLNQTDPNWKCIVGFDGIKEESIDKDLLVLDPKITYLYFPHRLGELHQNNQKIDELVLDHTAHGLAGQVRNNIIEHVTTEWIAFVDDDDTLISRYVELFNQEKVNNNFDCCSFRMRLSEGNANVLPPFHMGNTFTEQMCCNIGISFCVNKQFIDSNNIRFVNSGTEDFTFLQEIENKGGKIHISQYVTYNVKGCYYNCDHF